MTNRGLLVTFEGGDGAGKSTLLRALSQRCLESGRHVLMAREPGGTALGDAVRTILLNKQFEEPVDPRAELLLYLASRAQNAREQIAPGLAAGKVVLCDRYNDSSMAYQGYGRGLPLDEVRALCSFAVSGVQPRLTFYLDLPPSVGLQRVRNHATPDRLEREAMEFHDRCREGFLALAKQEPQRIHVLDATLKPEDLQEMAWSLLQPLL